MDYRRQNNDLIDISSIIKEWLSKWYWFAISAFVCSVLAFAYGSIKKPDYAVKANLLISQDDSDPTSMMGDISNLFGGSGYVEDEVFVVSSHSVLKDVCRDLGINKTFYLKDGLFSRQLRYKNSPLDVLIAPSVVDTLRGSVKFYVDVDAEGKATVEAKALKKVVFEVEDAKLPVTVKTPYGPFVIDKTPFYKKNEPVEMEINFMGYDGAAEELSKVVNIEIASQKSNVIAMTIVSTSVDYGKDVLNAIIKNYNIRGVETKSAQGLKTTEFIDQRLALISGDLEQSEANVEKYKKREGIVDVATEAQLNLGKKSQYETQMIAAETQLQITQMIRDFLRNPSNAYSLIPANGVGNEGVEKYNELVLKRMELEVNAKGNNQVLKTVSDQIDAMRDNILVALDRTYDQQQISLREMRHQVSLAEASLDQIPTQERQYRDILRQQTVKEQLYLYLLKRREETAMMAAASLPKGIIVDEAYALSDPVSMSKKMLVAIAFIFGLMLPPVVIYLRKAVRSKFSSREEVEALTPVPILGEVCNSKSKEPLVVRPGGSSSVAELFRLIRTNLQFVLPKKTNNVVLVTSSVSGEGKSFIAINLAASLALLGKKVLLIGMDIRKPKLAQYLDLQPSRGLTEYLAGGNLSLKDIIIKEPVADNFDIIVGGPVPPNPAEMLASNEIDVFFDEVRPMYEFVIVDSAPVGMVSDSFMLDRIADATVYVCRANKTSLNDISFLTQLYEQKRLKHLSLVVNGTTTTKGYGYGYKSKEDK